MSFNWKSMLSIALVIMSSTALMAAYTVPVWKPTEVLKKSNNSLADVADENKQDSPKSESRSDSALSILQGTTPPTTDAGKHIKTHRIRLSSDGFVPGKISLVNSHGELAGVENARVLLIKKGAIVTETKTDEKGNFQLANAAVGEYSLFAVSKKAFLAYSIEVVAPLPVGAKVSKSVDGVETTQVNIVEDENAELSIKSAAVPPQDFKAIYKIIDDYMPNVRHNSAVKSAVSDINSKGPTPDPVSELSAEPLVDDAANKDYRPDVSLSHNSVMLSKDNELIGRVRRYHPATGQPLRLKQMQAFLIQNGKITKAPIKEDGRFVFKNVEPGSYSFSAAGIEGFAAFGMNLIPNSSKTLAGADIPRELVLELALLANDSGGDGTLVGEEDLETGLQEQQNEDNGGGDNGAAGGNPGANATGNTGGNSGGSGSGGGGAGGAGGNMLPALLAAGGLATGIAALLDDKQSP